MSSPVTAKSTWCASTRPRRLDRHWARRPTPSTSGCSARESSPGGRSHQVLDGLETLDLLLETGNLLIHPRCSRLKAAFQTYCRQRRGGEWVDFPADGHPEEDLIDALRGGVRDAFPEGLVPKHGLRTVHASRIQG